MWARVVLIHCLRGAQLWLSDCLTSKLVMFCKFRVDSEKSTLLASTSNFLETLFAKGIGIDPYAEKCVFRPVSRVDPKPTSPRKHRGGFKRSTLLAPRSFFIATYSVGKKKAPFGAIAAIRNLLADLFQP